MRRMSVCVWVLFMLTVAAYGTEPALFFSDLTDGSVSGWEGSKTRGAAVSVWGRNFGGVRGGAYVTCGGVNLTSDTDYAEWGVVNEPANPWADVYSSARGLERITFWLNSSMTLGDGTITVTTGEGTSGAIPFHCRDTGNIYFISRDGDDNNSGLTTLTPWFSASKVRTLQAGDIAYFKAGVWNEDDQFGAVIAFIANNHNSGTENNSIAMASYPGEFAQLGDNTRQYVFAHMGTDYLDYWTYSKFILRARLITKNAQGSDYASRDTYNRWIGNDASTYAEGMTIFSFAAGYGGGQTYLHFYGNHLHDPNVDTRGDRGGGAYCLYFEGYGTHDNIDIGWNEISYASSGRGLQVFGHKNTDWIDNLYIHDNYIHHCAYQGAVLGGGDGTVPYAFVRNVWFYNNILAYNGNTDWIEPDTCGTSKGCFYNLAINSGLSGGEGGGNYYIYNNILYKTDNSEIRIQGTSDLIEIKNNVIWASPGKRYYEYVGDRWDTIDASNNCYFGGTDGIPDTDRDSIEQNPQFINPDSYDNPEFADFRVSVDSPCVDAGSWDVTNAGQRDYYGIDRPQGIEYDMGAHEYLSGGTPNRPPIITSLTANPTAGQVPLTVNFAVTAEDTDGTIESYTWNFADGTISSQQNPAHIYTAPGTYTPAVVVRDNQGAKTSGEVVVTGTEAIKLVKVIVRLADGRQARFRNLTEAAAVEMFLQIVEEEDYETIAIRRQPRSE
jgi:hypothetical protein